MIVAMLLALFAAAGLQGPDKMTTVRAFVYTATAASGQPTPEEQGRLDAVRDMRDALEKKKGITLVNSRADANLLIEVVSREQREEPGGGFGGKSVTRMGDTIIRLHLKSGDEESDLKGIGQGTWGRAAKDAADRDRQVDRPPRAASREDRSSVHSCVVAELSIAHYRQLSAVTRSSTRCGARATPRPASAAICISHDLRQPVAHVRAHGGVGALDFLRPSASARRAWNFGGSGVRRPVRSNSQFRISTWCFSIICRSSGLRACSAIQQVELHVVAVHREAELLVVGVRRQPGKEHVDLLGEPPQLQPLRGRGALGEEARRLRLERLAQLVQRAHVLVGVDAHARAGMRDGSRPAARPRAGAARPTRRRPSCRAARRAGAARAACRDAAVRGGSPRGWRRRRRRQGCRGIAATIRCYLTLRGKVARQMPRLMRKLLIVSASSSLLAPLRAPRAQRRARRRQSPSTSTSSTSKAARRRCSSRRPASRC